MTLTARAISSGYSKAQSRSRAQPTSIPMHRRQVMTTSALKETIETWCMQSENLSLVGTDSPSELRVQLSGVGLPAAVVAVTCSPDRADRIVLHHTSAWPLSLIEAFPGEDTAGKQKFFDHSVQDISLGHSGLLFCQTRYTEQTFEVLTRLPLFSDGFNQQTFLSSLGEVVKVGQQVEGMVTSWKEQGEEISRLEMELQQRPPVAPPAPVLPTGMTCPACKASNPEASRFCNQCGQSLCCPTCNAPVLPESSFCNRCGQRLKP